jgi:hypothetical protein
MKRIEIFDPAMCCSTGVCGPSIDPELMRISTVINSLSRKGIVIKRYNLTSEPQVFVNTPAVKELLSKEGAEALPITLVDGEVAKTKSYPTNAELSKWLGIRVKVDEAPKSGGCGCGDGSCC